MPSLFGTPEHWRQRAKEAREMATQIDDVEAKRSMLAVAEHYQQIARRAEARLAGVPPRPGKDR